MKVSIEQIEATLLERKIDPPKVAEIIKDLLQAAAEDKADNTANSTPNPKSQLLVSLTLEI